MNNKAIVTVAALAGAYLWKGKDIRASLSMTGAGWHNLHPEMQRRAAHVLSEANEVFKPLGLSVGVFSGWRTTEEQAGHIGSGASFVDGVYKSYHVWGLACDFVFLDRLGNWTWEPVGKYEAAWYDVFSDDPNLEAWKTLGGIIKKYGLEWGGDWKAFDAPHGQLTDYGNTQKLIAEYNVPNNVEWIA